jgi:hypothetical protein
MSRTPFDQIEAESELGAGYHTEYSGVKFSIFQLAEFMAPIITAIIVTVLFLAGTRGFSFLPGQVWFILKVVLVILMLLWIRATWPRLRVDQIMEFAWKGLFAVALANICLITVEVQLLQNPNTGELSVQSMWVMCAVNWLVTIVGFITVAGFWGRRRRTRPTPIPSLLANMNAAEAD